MTACNSAIGQNRLPVHFPFWTGDDSEDVTPVPIPNTTVKGLSGNDTTRLSVGK